MVEIPEVLQNSVLGRVIVSLQPNCRLGRFLFKLKKNSDSKSLKSRYKQ
jgi:hypothetical protein